MWHVGSSRELAWWLLSDYIQLKSDLHLFLILNCTKGIIFYESNFRRWFAYSRQRNLQNVLFHASWFDFFPRKLQKLAWLVGVCAFPLIRVIDTNATQVVSYGLSGHLYIESLVAFGESLSCLKFIRFSRKTYSLMAQTSRRQSSIALKWGQKEKFRKSAPISFSHPFGKWLQRLVKHFGQKGHVHVQPESS